MKADEFDGTLSQGESAEQRGQIRLGALAAIVGALLALIVNLLYPIPPDDPEPRLTEVAKILPANSSSSSPGAAR